MKINFENQEGCKVYRHGIYEFIANRQGRDGYSLEIWEWYKVQDTYIANKYYTRRMQIPYEPSSNIARIKERIINFITNN
jgi:hypothetical protein